jgi:hypothetical protein
MRRFIAHPATAVVLVLLLAGAGSFGFVSNAYVGIGLWAAAAVVVVAYGVGRLRDHYNRRFQLPTAGSGESQKKSKRIRTGDIYGPATFGKNSPIHQTTIVQGPPKRTFNGKRLDVMNKHISELAKFKGARLGLMADHGLDEPSSFAEEIGAVVQMAGWEVAYGPVSASIGSTGALPRGVVELGAQGEFPPEMAALESLLNAVSFPTIRSNELKISSDPCPWALVWKLP